MSEFDELRRGAFRADAAGRAAHQELEDLSRAGYAPDAVAKAREQEAADLADERAEARAVHRRAERRQAADARAASAQRQASQQQPARRDDRARDLADHTVMRRPQQGAAAEAEEQLGGGAVISRQSALGAALRRHARSDRKRAAEGSDRRRLAREQRRAARDERRYQREASGRGPHVPMLFVFLVLVVVAYALVFGPIDHAISLSRDERAGLSSELSWHMPATPYYVLALGSDAREQDEVSRSDTMILTRVDPLAGKITMLSIPRDTKVQIEGHGTQKINAAYAFGGVAGAVHAVHELTGAPISQVALVRFDGIESLVDYLGGVSVNVPVAVNDPSYTGLVLPAGPTEMDGHTALLFSRARHGFDLGDYQRQKDQRILIEAIMDKMLANPPHKLPEVVSHMGGMLGTTMRMYTILPLMLRLKVGGATVYQATVPSTSAMEDGVSYEVTDEAALSEMMELIDAGGDPATLM